jgi:ketosteroid isomerase-like protein
MIIIEKMSARVPGLWEAEGRGVLVPSRRIVAKLAPKTPDGKDVSPDFIEQRLGVRTIALTRQTWDFLEGAVWRGEGRPFGGMDREYRFLQRGGVVNEALMALVSECMAEVLPDTAEERAKVQRHIHIGLAPPTDMDRHLGMLRRQHGLPEHVPTEYVTQACPSLPAVLASLQRLSVAEEVLCLVTGEQNMLPFAQQYAALSPEDRTSINKWLYVGAFGEATGAALIRLCPAGARTAREGTWELVSASVDPVPGLGQDDWRGVISPEGAMEINVKNVIPTYKAAMALQVPAALDAIATRIRPDASPDERRAAAIESLHAYCFHESNFLLLSEMARDHAIPDKIVPRNCDRTGSLVGMSIFLTLSQALRTWEERRAAGERPKEFVAGSIVGQAGIAVACGRIVLRAAAVGNTAAQEEGRFTLTEAHAREALLPLSTDGDMRTFLRASARPDVDWRIMGHTAPICGSYTADQLQAVWDTLAARLHPARYLLHIDNVIVDTPKRTAIVEMHGDGPLPDGRHYKQSYCWILGFDGAGRVASVRAYLDTALATAAVSA